MATNYSPKVVTDGMVLYLDAANGRSYPGSGTTWYDLSDTGHSIALTNGPSYLSDVNGSFLFDGVNDYGVIPYSDSLNNTNTTMSVWIKSTFIVGPRARHYIFDGLSHYTMIFVDEPYEINFVVRVSGSYIYAIYSDVSVSSDSWINIVGTYDGEYVNLYVNGVLEASTYRAGVINSASGVGRVMDYIGGTYNTEGLASSFMMYNRGLTAGEVKQNFDAARSRFGL